MADDEKQELILFNSSSFTYLGAAFQTVGDAFLT